VLADYLLDHLEQRVQALLLSPGSVLAQVEESRDLQQIHKLLLVGDVLVQQQRQGRYEMLCQEDSVVAGLFRLFDCQFTIGGCLPSDRVLARSRLAYTAGDYLD